MRSPSSIGGSTPSSQPIQGGAEAPHSRITPLTVSETHPAGSRYPLVGHRWPAPSVNLLNPALTLRGGRCFDGGYDLAIIRDACRNYQRIVFYQQLRGGGGKR
jgi:hypothetical protein